MKKITLLAASALLLLTACGQVENRPAEVVHHRQPWYRRSFNSRK